MKFNIFDPYLFILSQLTLYCPPINHVRFEREFKNRYQLNHEQLSTNDDSCSTMIGFEGSKLLWVISNPIKVYKLVRDYYMLSNFNLISQILYFLVLIHLFVKSVIHTFIAGSDKERIKYFDSIYYPYIAGLSTRPKIFNYLFLGYTCFFLIVRTVRFRSMIIISLENANEYVDLRVSQLNSSYLASFYLSFKDWITLLKYTTRHEEYHSNEEIKISHLEFDNLVHKSLLKLSDLDAIFFVNPIDFKKCYEDSPLPNHSERRKRYKSWHFAYPIDRVSPAGLREFVIAAILRSIALSIGTFMAFFGFTYLELKSEFSADYSPSTLELISVAPTHFLSLIHCIRYSESILIITTQTLCVFDIICADIDFQTIICRTHKMVRIFQKHLEFLHREGKTKSFTREIKLNAKQRQTSFQANTQINSENNLKQNKSNDVHRVSLEYNRRIRHDVALVRLLYHEFLNVKKYHNGYLNIFILCEGICVAYLISGLISQPLSAEICVLVAALSATLIPIVILLSICARMERMVSL